MIFQNRTVKKNNWKTTDKRFVAFLDILGFKDLIMRKSHDEIYNSLSKISKIKNEIESTNFNLNSLEDYYDQSELYIVNFSDSIVIFSKDNSVFSFEHFIVMVRYLLGKCILNNIPIKGGISYGEISVNKSEQIYFGQPIIDAYLLEEDVNHIGVVFHNTVDNYIKENQLKIQDLKYLNKSFYTYKVPLKYGKLTHSCINWYKILIDSQESDDFDLKYGEIINKLNQFYFTASGNPRKYIDNTIELFNELLKNNIINLDKRNIT